MGEPEVLKEVHGFLSDGRSDSSLDVDVTEEEERSWRNRFSRLSKDAPAT